MEVDGNNNFKLLTKSECVEVVQNELHCYSFDIDLVSFKVVPVSNPEIVGMLGEYFYLIINANCKSLKPKTFEYFVKSIPVSDARQTEFVEKMNIFPKEAALYTTLFKEMAIYEISRWHPNCYYVRPDILVMEDLCKINYSHLNQYSVVTLNHLKVVLKGLATMHANSIAFEEKAGVNIGKKYREILKEINVSKEWEWFPVGIQAIKAVASSIPKFQNDQAKNFFSEDNVKCIDKMIEIVENRKDFRNVLCHRDLWIKNFFFKYDETDPSRPVDSLFVDFQLASYNPPALDVLHTIYLNTNRKMRDSHLDELLQYYHDCLRKDLKLAGIDIEEHITWKEFLRSCEYIKPVPLILSGLYAQFTKLPAGFLEEFRTKDSEGYDKCLNVDRKEFVFERMRKCKLYKEHLLECVEEIVDYLLKNSK